MGVVPDVGEGGVNKTQQPGRNEEGDDNRAPPPPLFEECHFWDFAFQLQGNSTEIGVGGGSPL